MPHMRHHSRSLLALAGVLVAMILAPPAFAGKLPAATPRPAPDARGAAVAPKPVLPWIEDDFARAVSQAKARKLPILVESWAPW